MIGIEKYFAAKSRDVWCVVRVIIGHSVVVKKKLWRHDCDTIHLRRGNRLSSDKTEVWTLNVFKMSTVQKINAFGTTYTNFSIFNKRERNNQL